MCGKRKAGRIMCRKDGDGISRTNDSDGNGITAANDAELTGTTGGTWVAGADCDHEGSFSY